VQTATVHRPFWHIGAPLETTHRAPHDPHDATLD
jgi:hypothetical protein